MNRSRLKDFVLIGACISLSLLFSMWKIWRLPQGGSVSLEMVPLIIISLLKGWRVGVAAGVIFSFLHLLQGPVIFNPMQFFLDYPLAFGAAGIAGIFSARGKSILPVIFAVISAFALRFFFHFLSGVIYVEKFAPAAAAYKYIYSLVYNGSYLGADLVLSLVIVPGVVRRLVKVI